MTGAAAGRGRFGEVPLTRLLIGGSGRLRSLYTVAMLVWASIYGLPLVVGALTAALLDDAADRPVPGSVWWLLAATVGLMLLRALLLVAGLQLTFRLIFRMSAWIKVEVLRELLGRPRPAGPELDRGEVLNRLREDSDEIGGLLEWTTDLVYRSVLTVVAVIVLLVTDVVTTIPLVLLLGGLLASVALKRRVAQAQAETRTRQGLIGAAVADTVTGVRDLRLSAALDQRLASLQASFADRRSFQVRHQFYTDLLSDLFRNLVLIGTAAVLLTMSFQTAAGQFSIGKLILFLTYSSWLGQQMYFFGKILARYQSGTVSYARLTALLPVPGPARAASADGAGPLRELRVRALSSPPDGGSAPAPVDVVVRPGAVVAITGELGSGKSTLVRGLLGLQPGTRGEVSWNGVDVTGDHEFLRVPRVGYARQSPRFLRGTVRENLVLGTGGLPDEQLVDALTAVGLRPGSAELPDGLDTHLDSGDAGRLSGGQRQRLALARMLCRPAEVYVVDDCDSSIDGPTAREIWRTLLTRDGAAWIVVSRNPDLLAAADTVIPVSRAGVAPVRP